MSFPRSRALSRALLRTWAAGILVASACGEPAAPPPSAGRSGTAVVAVSEEIDAINPAISAGSQLADDVQAQLFLSLFEEQPDFAERPPTFAPELADSWSFSADRLELTVRLRPDAVWSDGVPITAEDVRWTFEALTDPEVAWAYSHSKEAIEEVVAVDAHTVRFRFTTASTGQLADVNEGFVLPRHAWSALPLGEWRSNADWFRRHLVVSGPFRLERWDLGQRIVLTANPRYLEPERPRLERVVFELVPEVGNRLLQLRGGFVDFVDRVPVERAPELEGDPEVELIDYWPRQYTYLGWNLRHPLFADAVTRRALTLAIDRPSLVEALYLGRARVGTSPILSSVWAHDDELEPRPHSPRRARRELERLGWADRDGDGFVERAGEPFSFRLLVNSGSRLRVDAAVMIQEQLARVGVDAQPLLLESNTANRRMIAGEFEAVLSGWSIDTSLDLGYAFHSDSIEDGYNFVGYSDPEVDARIDAVRRSSDPEEIRRHLVALQRRLHRDLPYTILWEPARLVAHRTRLRGVRPTALTPYFDVEEWWVSDAGSGEER